MISFIRSGDVAILKIDIELILIKKYLKNVYKMYNFQFYIILIFKFQVDQLTHSGGTAIYENQNK